jgi:RimJ/RimL family protein N-acetyltransferase
MDRTCGRGGDILPGMSPGDTRPPLPEITLEATAKSFFKQALDYGFALGDFVRFVNILLRIAMAKREEESAPISGPPRSAQHAARELPLRGARVTIRRFGEPGDRDLLDRWLTDPEGRNFLLSMASGQHSDVDHLLSSPANVVGMIVHEDRAVGAVAYLDHNPAQRRAELRKLIGEAELRGRGLGREAAALWVSYGLGALQLEKIYLNTLVTHIKNIKLNEELGFRVEGILRNEVLIDGQHRDVLRMGLLHTDVH